MADWLGMLVGSGRHADAGGRRLRHLSTSRSCHGSWLCAEVAAEAWPSAGTNGTRRYTWLAVSIVDLTEKSARAIIIAIFFLSFWNSLYRALASTQAYWIEDGQQQACRVASTARPCRCRTSRDAEIASHRLLLVFWHNTGRGEKKKLPAGNAKF